MLETMLKVLEQIKRVDGNMSREQNGRYAELESMIKDLKDPQVYARRTIADDEEIGAIILAKFQKTGGNVALAIEGRFSPKEFQYLSLKMWEQGRNLIQDKERRTLYDIEFAMNLMKKSEPKDEE